VRSRVEALEPAEARERLLAADPDAGRWVALDNPRRVVRALEVLAITGRTPSQRAADPEAVAVRAYQPRHPVVPLGVDPGPGLGERIRQRFGAMLDAGLLAEVASLADRLGPTASQGVGYRELLAVVRGDAGLQDATRQAIAATTDLARRQRTFHRRDPRIQWLQWDDDPAVVAAAAAERLEEAGWTS
jgi:tRNA dimethylallyltransferase